MGAVKKVFKGVGRLLGFGGNETPTVEKADPTPTAVTTDDVAGDTDHNSKKRRRRGFATTQTASLAGGSDDGGRNTLG